MTRLEVLKIIAGKMSARDHAIQIGDEFKRTRKAPTDVELYEHDVGKKTVALYPIEPGYGETAVAFIDIDDHHGVGWEKVRGAADWLVDRFKQNGLTPFPVRSRSGDGIHLWLVFEKPVDAPKLHEFVRVNILDPLGLKDVAGKSIDQGCVEFLPKTRKVAAGNGHVGTAMCLPFAGKGCALDADFNDVIKVPDLPINDPAVIEQWTPPAATGKKPKTRKIGRAFFDEGNLRSALDRLTTDDRAVWIKYGMAIKQSAADAKFDEGKAFAVWADWSRRHGFAAPEHEDGRQAAWESFKLGAKDDPALVRIGSIFADAQAAGWEGHPHEAADRIVMFAADRGMQKIIDKVQDALLARGPAIYQRGGRLVRRVRLDHVEEKTDKRGAMKVRRDAGAIVLVDVDAVWLLNEMNNVLRWYRPKGDDEAQPAYPEMRYAQTLLAQKGSWRFPVLKGVIDHPIIDGDGRIIDEPGYDAESKLLLDFRPGAFPPIPREPNRWDAMSALEKLRHPFRAFPFVDVTDTGGSRDAAVTATASSSVHLSAMITAVIRASLATAPVHGYTAPTPGTGKTMLAEAAGIMATGVRPSLVPQAANEEEDEKRLTGCVLRGDPIIVIDNCDRPLHGRFLCSMTTGAMVDIRVLGKNDDNRIVPNTAFVLASGNNLTFASDMTRRCVMCSLDSGEERPEERQFDFNPRDEVRAMRPELVVAVLTILRAYHFAGRPVKVSPFGDFDDWGWVRGALIWLGCRDPVSTREGIKDGDPERATLMQIMDAWDHALGDGEMTLAKLGDENEGQFDVLRQRLIDATGRPVWNAISVGKWLTKFKDRPVGGRSLKQRIVSGAAVWRLAGGLSAADRERLTTAAMAAAKPKAGPPF